jgi:hypothetical protein
MRHKYNSVGKCVLRNVTERWPYSLRKVLRIHILMNFFTLFDVQKAAYKYEM